MADRRHDGRNNDRDRRSNYSQRDNRDHRVSRNNRPNNYRRDNVRVTRRPVHINNGRYHFNDGRSVRYSRPYIGVRYTNYRVRPVVLVENYEAQPGYVWVQGHWSWTGAEWSWISGHYAVDASYAY